MTIDKGVFNNSSCLNKGQPVISCTNVLNFLFITARFRKKKERVSMASVYLYTGFLNQPSIVYKKEEKKCTENMILHIHFSPTSKILDRGSYL